MPAEPITIGAALSLLADARFRIYSTPRAIPWKQDKLLDRIDAFMDAYVETELAAGRRHPQLLTAPQAPESRPRDGARGGTAKEDC